MSRRNSGPLFRNRNIWESRRQSKFYLGIWTATAKNNKKSTRCDKVEETEVWKPNYDSNSNTMRDLYLCRATVSAQSSQSWEPWISPEKKQAIIGGREI
jgi:hypothetical protein